MPTWSLLQGFVRIKGAGESNTLGVLQVTDRGVTEALGTLYKHPYPLIL